MKIGITCYPTYGGSGVVATELGIELAQRGHEIHFITYSQPFRLREPQPNINFHEVRSPPILCSTIRPTILRSPPAWRKSPDLCARPAARALRHSTFGECATGEADACQRAAAAQASICHHASRHRYHPRRTGSLVFADYSLLDRTERRSIGNLEVSSRRTYKEFNVRKTSR